MMWPKPKRYLYKNKPMQWLDGCDEFPVVRLFELFKNYDIIVIQTECFLIYDHSNFKSYLPKRRIGSNDSPKIIQRIYLNSGGPKKFSQYK